MANEAQIAVSLSVSVGELQFQSSPASFNADVSAAGGDGAVPGAVEATLAGALIDLSKLTAPGGFAVIQNLDATNYVSIGMRDPDSSKFYPVLDLLPGEIFVVRLARDYDTEFGAGTGTGGSGVQYYARVDPTQVTGTTAWVSVLAFNR